jgi:DNA polymerase III subunit alpha
MSFVHLHTHSNYSLLDGASRLDELVAAAARDEMPALALTDHNALYGAIPFHDLCRQAGIRPVIGMELSLVGGHSVVLLAEDQDGYRNLCRLSSALQTAPEREEAARRGAGWDLLARHAGGLIALSGGKQGEIEKLVRADESVEALRVAGRLSEIFGRDGVFIELQLQESEDMRVAVRLAMVARRAAIPCVATNNVHYVHPEDRERYRVLAAIRTLTPVNQPPPGRPLVPNAHFLSTAEMSSRFDHFPSAVQQSISIAERCQVEFPEGQLLFPWIDLPAGREAIDHLRCLAAAGLESRLGDVSPDMTDRLEHELTLIGELGYATYFLVVADVVQFAHRAGVPISSRGSASSSLVVYSLGISDVNPMDHDLYFERFLSHARKEPPDIDIDLCSLRRSEVIDYVYRRFGADRVAMVCTFSRLRARSALREVAKAYGISDERVDYLARQLPHMHPGMLSEVEDAQDRMLAGLSDPVERNAVQISRQLDLFPRHLSVHAGGIVIGPGPLTDWVGLQSSAIGHVITQADGKTVERLGLIKIDLLGIRGLSVLQSAGEHVRELHDPSFDLARIPDGDEATGRLLAAGETIGCFQIESAGMQNTCRQLQVRDTPGLIAAISLHRPAPLRGGLKLTFVRRFVGQEAVEYFHPALQPILAETLGVILYQEQVLRLAHEVAGMSLERADTLRRAMTRFRSAEEMSGLREEFMRGAWTVSGIPGKTADRIWSQMQAFAGYGFPKAHAAGYAVVAYRCAYMKAHYPAEFMAARLGDRGGYYPRRFYVSEARRMGLTIRPPHINHSLRDFALEYDAAGQPVLWMGLDQVRDVTRSTIALTIEERERSPFASLEDWLQRVHPRRKEAGHLVRVGALDGLGGGRRKMLRDLEWSAREVGAGQMILPQFAVLEDGEEADFSRQEVLKAEEELLGGVVSEHPMARFLPRVAAFDPVSSQRLVEYAGREVVVAGVRVTAWRHRAKRGGIMLFLTLEDTDGLIEVVVFPDVYERTRRRLSRRGPFVVWGRVQPPRDEGNELPVVIAQDVRLVRAWSDEAPAGRETEVDPSERD